MHQLRQLLALSLCVLSLLAAPSPRADEVNAAADPEEQLDQALKRFGYLAGLASGCVVEDQRSALEREALDLSAGIARLFGTDRAFLFAASFGYGTSISADVKDCAEIISSYEERVNGFRANHGGGVK